MKNNKGITMLSLALMIVVLIILATMTMYYGESAVKEAKLQDLKTNMLLIQASLKNDLEKYHFETSTLDEESKNNKKSEYLKGKALSDPSASDAEDVFNRIEENLQIKKKINKNYPQVSNFEISDNDIVYKSEKDKFEYYYLDTYTLSQIGLKDVKSDAENGYYIVAYSMNATYPNIVEVINTKVYKGNYSLKEIEGI